MTDLSFVWGLKCRAPSKLYQRFQFLRKTKITKINKIIKCRFLSKIAVHFAIFYFFTFAKCVQTNLEMTDWYFGVSTLTQI